MDKQKINEKAKSVNLKASNFDVVPAWSSSLFIRYHLKKN